MFSESREESPEETSQKAQNQTPPRKGGDQIKAAQGQARAQEGEALASSPA